VLMIPAGAPTPSFPGTPHSAGAVWAFASSIIDGISILFKFPLLNIWGNGMGKKEIIINMLTSAIANHFRYPRRISFCIDLLIFLSRLYRERILRERILIIASGRVSKLREKGI
ncbi:hypothetical protein, partial [Pseudanabaena sp. 'Roaring Creek']|uniref:hypothetical protein n=1 Tax=Pseudanabaena sp. 'Roaring Creek' TaxID=1681830 RepID=UPI0006D77B39